MNHNPSIIDRQHQLLARLTSLTANGSLHWENQRGSSHYYTDWDDILLILGSTQSFKTSKIPSYLRITPLFSVKWMEINSNDPQLRDSLLQLIYAVEAAVESQPPIDPFTSEDLLRLLDK